MIDDKNPVPLAWRAACVCLLLLAAQAGAGVTYKCVDATGAITFQAMPCDESATQTVMPVREQPLIGAGTPVSAMPVVRTARSSHASPRNSRGNVRSHRSPRRRRVAPATSWECRAADGEVFYRHTRCPHSVPGDGVMRSDGAYAVTRGRTSRSRARSAWDPVPVHARPVSRGEACRKINAAAAVDRDGSARDERVSVYEHDLGRDPCSGY